MKGAAWVTTSSQQYFIVCRMRGLSRTALRRFDIQVMYNVRRSAAPDY
jgi:hypothetical protein